jgi:hypothetical protein
MWKLACCEKMSKLYLLAWNSCVAVVLLFARQIHSLHVQ